MSGATIDIAGAARATGLTVKAIRGRVERGSLPAVLVDGRRRIPISALLEAGLLVKEPRSNVEVDPLVAEVRALRTDVRRLADEVALLRAAR